MLLNYKVFEDSFKSPAIYLFFQMHKIQPWLIKLIGYGAKYSTI